MHSSIIRSKPAEEGRTGVKAELANGSLLSLPSTSLSLQRSHVIDLPVAVRSSACTLDGLSAVRVLISMSNVTLLIKVNNLRIFCMFYVSESPRWIIKN